MGRHSKSESDIEDDGRVGGSRVSGRDDGSHLGRTASEEDVDAGRTGAEARSQEA
jgi:hypothetical protein